jgi:WD40 repeat protein
MNTSFTGHQNKEYSINSGLNYSNSLVASGSEDGKAYIWELVESGIPACTLNYSISKTPVHCISWHPKESGMLATAGAEGSIKVWSS